MKQKNLNHMQFMVNCMKNLVRWLFSILNSFSPLRHFIISLIILTLVMFAGYHIFDFFGYLDFFLRKLEGSFILHGLRTLFRICGCQMPILLGTLLFCLTAVLGLDSNLHMMDPAGGQPAANPVAEQAVPAQQPPAPAQAPGAVDQPPLDNEALEQLRRDTRTKLGIYLSIGGAQSVYGPTYNQCWDSLGGETASQEDLIRIQEHLNAHISNPNQQQFGKLPKDRAIFIFNEIIGEEDESDE